MFAADIESSVSSAASITAASEEGSEEPGFGATGHGKAAAALSSAASITAASEAGSEEPVLGASTDAMSQMRGLSHAVVCMG